MKPPCLALVSLITAPALAQEWRIETFTIPGTSVVVPHDISDAGVIVGTFRDTAAHYHGFTRDAAGTVVTVDEPSSTNSILHGINQVGVVLGSRRPGTPAGFRYQNGTTTLYSIPGLSTAAGSGLNDAGLMVGGYTDSQARDHGFFWPGSGGATTLDYPGAQHSVLVDVDDAGRMIGNYWVFGSGRWRGFAYDRSAFTTLDMPGAHWTYLMGMNSSGWLVGQRVDTSGALRSAIYYDGSAFHDFVVPGATGWTDLQGINAFGEMAGSWQGTHLGVSGQHAFLARPCQPDLGHATPGGARLTVCGQWLRAGGTADLEISGAPAGAAVWVGVGRSSNPVPIFGGAWVPLPVDLVLPLRADAGGDVVLPGLRGGGGPLDLYVQAVVQDAAAPAGFTVTNAVRVQVER
ncbi:MAG: hypothetical protein R3F56_25045 [Planctomycetota bacterium]